MHKLQELKEMLCDELEKYSGKDITSGTLEVVDKLTHTIKNLDKIIEKYEGESYGYGMNYGPNNMNYGRMMPDQRNASYAGRRNARRDSMGRYSRGGEDMASELRELMQEAPENMRGEFQKLISKIEYM
jgi:hypothetical protein